MQCPTCNQDCHAEQLMRLPGDYEEHAERCYFTETCPDCGEPTEDFERLIDEWLAALRADDAEREAAIAAGEDPTQEGS